MYKYQCYIKYNIGYGVENGQNHTRPRHKVTSVQSNWNTFNPPRFNQRPSNRRDNAIYTETEYQKRKSNSTISHPHLHKNGRSRLITKSSMTLSPTKPPRLSTISKRIMDAKTATITKPFTLTPTPDTMHLFDSSFSLPDAEKVSHILEVMHMDTSDYQTVVQIFRRYGFKNAILLPVKHRHFICFDSHECAVAALNHIKHKRFKFKRVDCDIYDINMLKFVVPPPLIKPIKKILSKSIGTGCGTETQIKNKSGQKKKKNEKKRVGMKIIMEKQGAMTPAQIEEEQRIRKSIATQTSVDISQTISKMIKIQPSKRPKDKIITSADIESMKRKKKQQQEKEKEECVDIISREDIIKITTPSLQQKQKEIDRKNKKIKEATAKAKRHTRMNRMRCTILMKTIKADQPPPIAAPKTGFNIFIFFSFLIVQ